MSSVRAYSILEYGWFRHRWRRRDIGIDIYVCIDIDSNKLKYGPATFDAGRPSSLGFGVAALSYSNFLATTVGSKQHTRQCVHYDLCFGECKSALFRQ